MSPSIISLTPRYVVVKDYEEYVDGWETQNIAELEKLLARAERYIDSLAAGIPIKPCDAVQKLVVAFTSPPTGGYITLSFVFRGVTYTSKEIPWNTESSEFVQAMEKAEGGGAVFPGSVQSYPGKQTPFVPCGPLPFEPLVWVFSGEAGGHPFSAATVANHLTGGSEVVPEVFVVTPGAPWGGRFNPSELLAFNQLESLKRAVCAQAEYMYDMGPRFFTEWQYPQIKGPDFTTTGRPPKIAPKARMELAQAGLRPSMARSRT